MERMLDRMVQKPGRATELYTNKNYLIGEIQDFLDKQALVSGFEDSKLTIKTTSTPALPSHGSEVEVKLAPANRVDIKTLVENIGTTLSGRFFLCRCITPPHKMISIDYTVVDDPEGQQAVRIALYEYTSSMNSMEQMLPVGLILAIKNPWFTPTFDGGFTVRCDNPADDVVIITPKTFTGLFPTLKWNGEIPAQYRSRAVGLSSSALKPKEEPAEDVLKFKNLGNKSFVDKQFVDAIRLYTQGLEIAPQNLDLLSNRAASYLNLGCYNKALADITIVLEIDPFNIKGIYRTVKSLWGLNRYKEAAELLTEKFNKKSDLKKSKELVSLRKKAEQLLNEHLTGELDMVTILKEKGNPEVAEFTGPVKITNIPGKGRGLVATAPVKPGQLLICSKAFAFAPPSPKDKTTVLLEMVMKNLETIGLTPGPSRYQVQAGRNNLVAAIVKKLTFEPELGRTFFQLFAGPELGYLEADSDAIEKVGWKRIDRIVAFNAFSGNVGSATGVWIMPSYLNHGCFDANCSWGFYGDVMLIRAVKQIKKGEEILISYNMNLDSDLVTRQSVFRGHVFNCECRLCTLESEDGVDVHNHRLEIFKSLQKNKDSWPSYTNFQREIDEILKLTNLQQKCPKLNLSLAHSAVAELALHLMRIGDVVQSIELLEKMHFVTKDTIYAQKAANFSVKILNCYLALLDLVKIEEWVKIVKHDLLVAYGSIEAIEVVTLGSVVLELLGPIGIEFFD